MACDYIEFYFYLGTELLGIITIQAQGTMGETIPKRLYKSFRPVG